MKQLINVYCDESCHLENDGQIAMVLGAVWSPNEKKREISERIKEIKIKHGMPADFEFKWTKVSPSKLKMYSDVIDYFFDDDDLKFRCLVAPDKSILNHDNFEQSHDDWYYKMYYHLISVLLKPKHQYHIYIDIKDSRSVNKVRKLHDILCNSAFDFSRTMLAKIQQVRSHEVAQLQIADLLIGAMSYKARKKTGNAAKLALIERISKRSGYKLDRSTLYREEKFNIFFWQGATK